MFELIPEFLPAFFIELPFFYKLVIVSYCVWLKARSQSLYRTASTSTDGMLIGFVFQIVAHDNNEALLWVGGMIVSLAFVFWFVSFLGIFRIE